MGRLKTGSASHGRGRPGEVERGKWPVPDAFKKSVVARFDECTVTDKDAGFAALQFGAPGKRRQALASGESKTLCCGRWHPSPAGAGCGPPPRDEIAKPLG